MVSFLLYLWVVERTKSQIPLDEPLSQLAKKPSIYFLYTFEASILKNDSEFSTVSSQFITVRMYLPITPEIVITFRLLESHQLPQL